MQGNSLFVFMGVAWGILCAIGANAADVVGTIRHFDAPIEQMRNFVASSPDSLREQGWNRPILSPQGDNAFLLQFSGGYNCFVTLNPEDSAHTGVLVQCDDVRGANNPSIAARNMEKDYLGVLTGSIAKVRLNQQAASASIKKEELSTVVQDAIKGALASQKHETSPQAKTAAVESDIDKPNFRAAERIMGDNDLAVIIGIEGYQSLPKSDYSYDDARLVKDYVKALGFKERNIELITEEKATLSGIVKTVEVWLKNKAKPQSRVFVYYSGHGAPDPSSGEAYLVPYDGDPNYLSVTGYSLKRLYASLGKLREAEVTVVIDACFSGTGGRSVLAKGARPLVMMTENLTLPSNMAVLSATQGSQISTSSPDRGHGIFTYYFLKALKDGNKDLGEIYGYLKPLVEDDAKALNVQQSPSLNPAPEKLAGRFNLRK